uniref:Uncharacterized protein n=2 Tax=Davidia involucrata TaxID=16924 RepID=A0A5B6YK64_DAVIN
MDWYFGNDVDYLVVPKDWEPLDRLLSLDSWSLLGITAPESFASSNKCAVKGTNSTEEGFYFNVNRDLSAHDGVHSSNSSIFGGLREGSLQQTLPHEWSDYQLNDLARIDQTDDIFLNSFFEEDKTGTESESFSYSPETEYDISSHTRRKLAPVVNVSVPSEQYSMHGHVGDETSLEESVLQELERVMAQLTDRTRICFRDGLYRLAENSKQHAVNQSHNGVFISEKPPSSTIHDETYRLVKTEVTESETNTIDRAIANLMSNTMDSNAQDFPAEASAGFKPEASETRGSFIYSLDASQTPPYFPCPTSLTRDTEVPNFGQDSLLTMRNMHTDRFLK